MGSVELLPAVRPSSALQPQRGGGTVRIERVQRVERGSDPRMRPFPPLRWDDPVAAYVTAGVPAPASLVDLLAQAAGASRRRTRTGTYHCE